MPGAFLSIPSVSILGWKPPHHSRYNYIQIMWSSESPDSSLHFLHSPVSCSVDINVSRGRWAGHDRVALSQIRERMGFHCSLMYSWESRTCYKMMGTEGHDDHLLITSRHFVWSPVSRGLGLYTPGPPSGMALVFTEPGVWVWTPTLLSVFWFHC